MESQSKHSVSVLIFLTLSLSSARWTFVEGCEVGELGIKVPSSRRIPDKHMTSSSQLSNSYPAFRGRIGVETRGSWGNGWCALESDADPYIQVFFELLTTIVIIESEGITIDGNKMWVKSYQVSTSNDSQSWTGYPEENAIELQANTDVQATNVSLNNTWAHFIRIYPKRHEGKWICMRIALYGCQTGKHGPTVFSDVLNDAPFVKTPLKETLFLVIPIVVFGCLLMAGIMCFCRRYRARRSHKEKQTTPTAEVSRRIDSGVTYEEPPHYEFQTVSLDFGHDVHDRREIQSEMPAFTETNKIFSFDRNAASSGN